MLFSCHTFPKRLAAAPIVAAEGGLLGWSFRPPAVAPLSQGLVVRERGSNNGKPELRQALNKGKILMEIEFRCMDQIWKSVHSGISKLL